MSINAPYSTAPDVDPLAGGDKAPALSWRDAPIGTTYTGVVTEAPKLVQSRDYETGDPAFWDAEKTQPKMSVVVNLTVDGEDRSLWAQKPSAMFAALAQAQREAGQRIAVGGTLAVKLTGEKPNAKNPRLNPQKLYAARYTPPAGGSGDDPFAAPAQQPAQQPAQPVQTAGFGDTPPF